MDPRVAKEVLHLQEWLERLREIVSRGEEAYTNDVLLQEAGDSLMMKIGEAANRLSRNAVAEPAGIDWSIAVANRNFLIHQYDDINRHMTWLTISRDLEEWRDALLPLVSMAQVTLEEDVR